MNRMTKGFEWKKQTRTQKIVFVAFCIAAALIAIIGAILFYAYGRENFVYLKIGQMLVCPIAVLMLAIGFSLRDALSLECFPALRTLRAAAFVLGTGWYIGKSSWQMTEPDGIYYWGSTSESLKGLVAALAVIVAMSLVIRTKEQTLEDERIEEGKH
jgi:uncharacterized membrane protein